MNHLPAFLRRLSVCLAVLAATMMSLSAQDDAEHFFETKIRPILSQHCSKCHSATKQSGELRVDSLEHLLKGGDSGPAIVPKHADDSLLIQAVRRNDEIAMPPDEALSAEQVRQLEHWVSIGAPWPASTDAGADSRFAEKHWAFQAVAEPAVPEVREAGWNRSPIDAFVLSQLENAGLAHSLEADRRTLIRRVTFTLTGLPPTPEAVAEFVADDDPQAWEQLVERLLNSPQYGEHWARHWLDVARYSDTKGYVYAREERFWVHAWAYRDWVVRALNEDMPYDRFLLLQIAADQIDDRRREDLAAMGYLTLGRRFLGIERDIIDDRIDVVCRGTMALTVGCARCHDHKYDPIPTADYYSLYGVFDSCAEKMESLGDDTIGDEAFRAELAKRKSQLRESTAKHRKDSADKVRARVADYLTAQTELEKYPAKGFDQVFEPNDILPAFVHRWRNYLHAAKLSDDPIWMHWHAYAALPEGSFAEEAAVITKTLLTNEGVSANPLIAAEFATTPKSFDEVIRCYADVLTRVDQQWRIAVAKATEAGLPAPPSLGDTAAELLRTVLYGETAPCEVPNEPIVGTESFFTTAVCTELWKLQGEVDRWLINSEVQAPYALALVDQPVPSEPQIFRRGDPLDPGETVPRHFLSLLKDISAAPFRQGSGRFELAQAIVEPTNPLTARVIVNRVWAKHFGKGLVPTTSDFGLRADDPSHPELLDWLSTEFIRSGWSLKELHRRILLSSTWRQSCSGPPDTDGLSRAMKLDPANRLLWRMNEHRLTFEEFRDSLLAASGRLDLSSGGKPVDIFKQPFPARRTLYGLVDRQYLPGTLRVFDFANPDLHTPERNETTVPQQSLFFMNHPFVLDQAKALAARSGPLSGPSGAGDAARVAAIFQQVLQRDPTENEIADSLALVAAASRETSPGPPATAGDWSYGYGAIDEAEHKVSSFTALPHFTGSAWQGGAKWPDTALGWVQLTATGGHPGNDREHASIRRWTAPRNLSIRIQSEVVHEPAAGDGIRVFVVGSEAGQLAAQTVHQKTISIDSESIAVQAGDTIDFLVDIGNVLNSDQHFWRISITEVDGGTKTVWNSETDFTHNSSAQLTEWEQLAHVLLCTNEFLFVD